MTKLVIGFVLLMIGLMVRKTATSVGGKLAGGLAGIASLALILIGGMSLVTASMVVIDAGQVGVQHAFGKVSAAPLLPGIRFVPPWSQIERYSTREEQYPRGSVEAEQMSALSAEQMSMQVDVAVRWQIDPMMAPKIFTEIGTEEQIHAVVMNAIRNGVRDGIVQFSINDIARRNEIAKVMEAEVDSALVTQPRAGGDPFKIATVTAFFLRNLEPPAQVVQAINNKIAQEQQIATERHRVEVARLQSEQQKLLNLTLTPEALMKQYLEVLHDMKNSNNLVVLVPTEGGTPLLDLARLRTTLNRGQQ
jgi:regulator of protease activity HflC (stomatin/prohibitin superfamily)